jgi:diacylglycerol kinase family enzyme
VLTGGGDGTFVQTVTVITQVAAELGKPRPRFGLLRLGTGNALAWVLGAQNPRGRGVVADLARLRNEGGSRKLRLLEVEGLLTPFAGVGIDSIALAHFNRTKELFRSTPLLRRFGRGGAAYFVSIVGRTMPEYLFRSHPQVRIVNEGDEVVRLGVDGRPVGDPIVRGEVVYAGPTRLVGMSTIPYWGFGARIFPYADEREDRFHLRVADVGSVEVALHIRAIWRGTYQPDTVHDFLAERVSVHFEAPMPLQIGGDEVGVRRVIRARLAADPIDVVDYYAPPTSIA